jgi:hypothetical protein
LVLVSEYRWAEEIGRNRDDSGEMPLSPDELASQPSRRVRGVLAALGLSMYAEGMQAEVCVIVRVG